MWCKKKSISAKLRHESRPKVKRFMERRFVLYTRSISRLHRCFKFVVVCVGGQSKMVFKDENSL